MVARLLCRELTLQNEYLHAENKILKSKIKGRKCRFNLCVKRVNHVVLTGLKECRRKGLSRDVFWRHVN